MTDPERDLNLTAERQRELRNEQDIDEVITRLELPVGAVEELGLTTEQIRSGEGLDLARARQRLSVAQLPPEVAGLDVLERVATEGTQEAVANPSLIPYERTPQIDTDLQDFYNAIGRPVPNNT